MATHFKNKYRITFLPAGRHTVHWNGRSATGLEPATGMYVYRLQFEDRVLSNKFLLLR